MTDWEPSYLVICKGEPSLTNMDDIRAYWREWREQNGFSQDNRGAEDVRHTDGAAEGGARQEDAHG